MSGSPIKLEFTLKSQAVVYTHTDHDKGIHVLSFTIDSGDALEMSRQFSERAKQLKKIHENLQRIHVSMRIPEDVSFVPHPTGCTVDFVLPRKTARALADELHSISHELLSLDPE